MAKHKDLLTLNGKVFDVKAGTRRPASFSFDKKQRPAMQNPRPQPQPSEEHVIAVRVKTKPKRSTYSATNIHKRHERTKTLARNFASRPKSAQPASLTTRLEPDSSVLNIDELVVNFKDQQAKKRAEHAKHINKSHLINRFSGYSISGDEPTYETKVESIEVKLAPPPASELPQSVASKAPGQSKSEQVFDDALKHASAHLQPMAKHPSRKHRTAKQLHLSPKMLNIGASVLVVLGLVGFIAYQNQANIAVKLASTRAGISADLPSYRPPGFSLSKSVEAQPGRVTLSFNSNSDNRAFKISQVASDWNSQTLLDNFVATKDQPYEQALTDNGKTVFIYGESGITWVDGGLWFNIDGSSSLNPNQLLKLAASF